MLKENIMLRKYIFKKILKVLMRLSQNLDLNLVPVSDGTQKWLWNNNTFYPSSLSLIHFIRHIERQLSRKACRIIPKKF